MISRSSSMSAATDSEAPLFGVRSSVTGKDWRLSETDERLSLAIAQRHGLPEILGRILSARNVAPDAVDDFLNPSLKTFLPDPSHLKDMDKAVEIIVAAIEKKRGIWVFGDYDVDGGTSAAMLIRHCRDLGVDCRLYVPDRVAEGYGPNGPALKGIKTKGGDLVISVDCGTLSFGAFEQAAEVGLTCVVVDHHAAEPNLPKVAALVNPNRLDDDSPHKQMAACGVTFLLCVALNRALREKGVFKGRNEPNLMQLLDLVALGTVCDVVPLTGVNRAFVAQGLKVMAARGNAGLSALADVARIDEEPGTYHAGFILGPRINAGGRVGRSDLGATLLATDDPAKAAIIAEQLDRYNQERQDIETAVLAQAMERAGDMAARASFREPAIVVASEGWHQGVVGIVASRLKDRFNRPACVIALDGETGSGSGRSIAGVDLGAAVIAAYQAGILIKGGGHAMAAGFSLSAGNVGVFRSFLNERLSKAVEAAAANAILTLDGILQPGAVNSGLIETIARVGPFGVGNPEPRFLLPYIRIAYADRIGRDGAHVKLSIVGEGGDRVAGICFRAFDRGLGQALTDHGGRAMHVIGRARLDNWQGRATARFQVEDAAFA